MIHFLIKNSINNENRINEQFQTDFFKLYKPKKNISRVFCCAGKNNVILFILFSKLHRFNLSSELLSKYKESTRRNFENKILLTLQKIHYSLPESLKILLICYREQDRDKCFKF
jgi:hypothetical protein